MELVKKIASKWAVCMPRVEPDQARRARCLSSQFRIARVLQTCACDECTNRFASEEGFRLTLWQAQQASSCLRTFRPKSVGESDVRLWQVAQAGSCLRAVSDVRLWRMHKQVLVGTVHALRQSCERFPRGTLEKLSRQHTAENQPEYDWKAAGARQHLSDDTDVDQCTGCAVELLYVVRFQVGRLCAQCWTCLNVWPFARRTRREAASRMSREA